MHPNTVRYRLTSIEKQTHLAVITDDSDYMAAQIAMDDRASERSAVARALPRRRSSELGDRPARFDPQVEQTAAERCAERADPESYSD